MPDEQKPHWIIEHATKVAVSVLLGGTLTSLAVIFGLPAIQEMAKEYVSGEEVKFNKSSNSVEMEILGFSLGATKLSEFIVEMGISASSVKSKKLDEDTFGDRNVFQNIGGKIADAALVTSLHYSAYFQDDVLKVVRFWYTCESNSCFENCRMHSDFFKGWYFNRFGVALSEPALHEWDEEISDQVYDNQVGRRSEFFRFNQWISRDRRKNSVITSSTLYRGKFTRFYSRDLDRKYEWEPWKRDDSGDNPDWGHYCQPYFSIDLF